MKVCVHNLNLLKLQQWPMLSFMHMPLEGAHVLRHSAATQMLRQGASLPSIGAMLRHASGETTAHYAKVDIALLRDVARAWPEVAPCS